MVRVIDGVATLSEGAYWYFVQDRETFETTAETEEE